MMMHASSTMSFSICFLLLSSSFSYGQTLDQIFETMLSFQKEAFQLQKYCKELTRECHTKAQQIFNDRNNYVQKIISNKVSFHCAFIPPASSVSSDTFIECNNKYGDITIINISPKCTGRLYSESEEYGKVRFCFTDKLYAKDVIQVEGRISGISDCIHEKFVPNYYETATCDPRYRIEIKIGGYTKQDFGPVDIKLR